MSNFDSTQRSYYVREINREIPVNAIPADTITLETALGTSLTNTPATLKNDVSSFVSTFGRDSAAIQRDAACKQLTTPTGMRDPAARTGCGWWYAPDQNAKSTAAYGSRRGPMDLTLDTKFGTGQWVWDETQAAALEGQKQAARLQSCADLQYSTYPNLGWCTSTNMGIMTDGRGNPLSPQGPAGDCAGGQIITSYQSCPAPPQPSQPGGGPTPGSGAGGIAGLCQPQSDGSLSSGCLQSLNNQICSPNGTLSLALGSGYAGGYQPFMDTYGVLQQRGFSLPAGVLQGGQVDQQTALGGFTQLRTRANAGDQSTATRAASNLCYGTAFDPCALAPTDVPPFNPNCVTQAATAKGYSPKGTALPANSPDTWWNTQPNWQAVLDQLDFWKTSTQGQGSLAQQSDGLQRVFGVTIKPPKVGCNVNGVEVFRYTGPQATSNFPNTGPTSHVLGRTILRNGFPNNASTMDDMTLAGGQLTEGQRFVTLFQAPTTGVYQFQIVSDDGSRIWLNSLSPSDPAASANDQLQMDWHWCCGPSGTTQQFNLVETQYYKLTVDLWNGGGPWGLVLTYSVNGGAWQPLLPTQLFLLQDRRKPWFELDFTRMAPDSPAANTQIQVRDTRGVFSNLFRWNSPIQPIAGVNCMTVNAAGGLSFGNFMGTCQGVRLRALKSFTMKLFISNITTSANGATPSLFGIHNHTDTQIGNLGMSWRPTIQNGPSTFTQDFQVTAGPSGIYPWNLTAGPDFSAGWSSGIKGAFPMNQWFHFAFVWDDNFMGYTLYLNGSSVGHGTLTTAYPVDLVMEQIRLGNDYNVDGRGWNGGIAWFRGFDYSLTPTDVQTDANDGWVNL